MDSVDAILGAPQPASVDAILGPEQQVPPHNSPVHDNVINRMPAGRVLDAFGQGFHDSFGSEPILSPETEAAMQSARMDKSIFGGVRRSFNEVFFRPAATMLSGGMRAAAALPGGVGRAVGEVMNETGVTKLVGSTEEKSLRDWQEMGMIAPMALGVADSLGVVARPSGAKGRYVAPVEQATEGPMVAALRLPDGKVVHGKPGQNHGDLFGDLEHWLNDEKIPIDDQASGFSRGPGTPWMSRKDAAQSLGHDKSFIGTEDLPSSKTIASDEGLTMEPHSRFSEPESSVLDKAGNINLTRIRAPEDVKDVIRRAADENNQFLEPRRGVMSLAETEQLADAVGMTSETLLSRKVGEAFNAEQAVAARNMLVQSATEVRNLAAKALGGTEQDLLAFQEATTKHTAIQEQVAGMTAEAGRALSSFRVVAGEEGGIADVLHAFGGRESIENIARKINELDSPAKVSKFLMDARKATTGDMLIEAWINGLLSGPTTHIVNTLSNVTTALWNVPETALAAGIAIGRGAKDSVRFGEAGQELFAIVQGSRDGLRAAAKAFREDGPPAQTGQKMDTGRRAIPSAKVNIAGREIELGGKQIRIPGRALSASDEYFKAIGARQALNRLAYRKASQEGLTGQAHSARLAQLVENPSSAMREAARETAEYQTFTNPLGEFGASLQKVQQSNKVARLVLTFIRTPVNIAKYTVKDRTLLGLFSKEIRDNLASKDPVVRDTTLARLSLGTAVSVTAVGLAAQGLITGGGPKDPKERAALYATGWQPYSVRIDEMYYSYGRIEPLSTLLGLPADMYDKAGDVKADDSTTEQLEKVAGLVVASLAKNLASKTSLTGLTDLVQAVEDPDRYGKQYLSKLAASAVPNVLAQTARMEDPYMRDARTFLDLVQTRIPGMSENVAPRLDIWGQPIPNQHGVGAVTGIYESTANQDPVNQELMALEVFPAKPLRKIKGVELDGPQYEEYQMTAGRLAKTQLDGMVNQEGWMNMPTFARKELIENTIRNSRQAAAGLMQMKYPSLIQKGVEQRMDEIRGVKK